MTDEAPPLGDADELPDEVELPSRASFFDVGDGANERVCASIWSMFQRWQNSRGFDARSKASKIATKLHQAGKTGCSVLGRARTTMARGDLRAAVSAAHVRLTSALGRPPTGRELFDEVGERVGKNYNNVAQCAKGALGLELTRLRAGSRPAHSVNAPKSEVFVPAPRVQTSDDPVVAALIIRRDAFLEKARALDTAIAAMGGAA